METIHNCMDSAEGGLVGQVVAGNVELTELGARHVIEADAADCWEVVLPQGDDRDVAALTQQVLVSSPGWVDKLMQLRNAVVKPLGLKGSNSEEGEQKLRFPLLEKGSDELILGVDDKHLTFWVSSRLVENSKFRMTTYVRINNKLGRLYWGVVRHFHPLVVRSGMRRL